MVWFWGLCQRNREFEAHVHGWYNTHHRVSADVRLSYVLGLLDWLLADNLHPVIIRVQDECNVAHPTVCQLLLEPVASVLDPLARRLDIINADTGMAETSVRLPVS